ncbi:MAG: GMC family oxidoreductase [Deltaproteobacteria bacterium]|nr:GMC family oxidoreductase [Deltaproteobacteria bacterium]
MPTKRQESFDLVLAGTGFASSFFLLKYREKYPNARVLVLEQGNHDTHEWKVENRKLMDPSGVVSSIDFRTTFINETPPKDWIYTPGLGGSSNCWWACTPRFLPSDLKLKSTYGIGSDWPLTYDELEPYYGEAERIMLISGDSERSPFRRSTPYPQRAHRFNNVDKLILKEYPDNFYCMPSARPRAFSDKRAKCCASSVCNLCPIDAKFTVLNELAHLYFDSATKLELSSQAISLDIENNTAKQIRYLQAGREKTARAEIFALGCNPIFNSQILLASSINNPLIGRGISEQMTVSCDVLLDGVKNFDGSSALTGHGYMFYDGEHRRSRAACLLQTQNIPKIRLQRGKYTERATFKFLFEDLPQADNFVKLSDEVGKPSVHFANYSTYAIQSLAHIKSIFEKAFSSLPIESYNFSEPLPTDGHILGTAPMGENLETSVVDRQQLIHGIRNVFVLGGSSFSSVPPPNPTLTICALSLWSADRGL